MEEFIIAKIGLSWYVLRRVEDFGGWFYRDVCYVDNWEDAEMVREALQGVHDG